MKRKILLTVAVILTVMLSACGMSEEEIGTALSNINNEYQSGTYEPVSYTHLSYGRTKQ